MQKRNLICVLVLLFYTLSVNSQVQKGKGYPSKDPRMDVLSHFVHPPKGYGNIPYFWWDGDSLDIKRLHEQLDILSSSATDGFSVSYIHQDPDVDIEAHKNGYGLFGKTDGGKPSLFSDGWWKVWTDFTKDCAGRGLGVGLDDYTIGWKGNGYYPDDLAKLSKFQHYQGELEIESVAVAGNNMLEKLLPQNIVTVVAYPGKIDLNPYISSGKIKWKAPSGKAFKVYIISTKTNYLLHPDFGKELVKSYFDVFEKKAGDYAKSGMNYFFQDELLYPIDFGVWSEDFQYEFKKRKGYDICLYLPALTDNIGDITTKIRMDYCDVVLDLAEERYFKPKYDWQAERGLIYGSDNLERGINPLAYLDYFRANSWYTAPGNDAPAKGSSFLSTKISSSIAHLYERPRTWLEAFHSMGWSSSGSWLTRQINHHFMAGGNLLCMHGLYYTTHGGWWEWAPPCFHFRMPYWPHMKKWLEYTERLSYLMSQGNHVCDIAIVYPTETMQAYPEATPQKAFDTALKLSNAGLDYDFINYVALRKASVRDSMLHVSDEHYRIVVLVDMKAMHYSSLEKILAHYRSGGIVIASGELPKSTTKSGENDKDIDAMMKEMFGITAHDATLRRENTKKTNKAGGVGLYVANSDSIPSVIHSLITPDFRPMGGVGKVLHRKVGFRDVYMVMDVPKNTKCFFRNTGKVELWDASNGSTKPFPVVERTDKGSWLKLDEGVDDAFLLVFSPGEPLLAKKEQSDEKLLKEINLGGDWEVELLPTMNNKWGDFRLPASNEFISAEARAFRYHPDDHSKQDWMKPDFDDSNWKESIYGYGLQALLDTIPTNIPIEKAIDAVSVNQSMPYEYSWQYGVWNNPGAQGMHGLKGKVDDRFFILNSGSHQVYNTYAYAPANGMYKMVTEGVKPSFVLVDGKNNVADMYLAKGWHKLSIGYANTHKVDYKMQIGEYHDLRDRSAVVLYPQSSQIHAKYTLYSDTISMKWGFSDHLKYDPFGGKYKRWNYRFSSVPGLRAMTFKIAGKNLKVWFDGLPVSKKNVCLLKHDNTGINTYRVVLPETQKKVGIVAFSLEQEKGYQGTGAIPEPVKLETEKGLMNTGDWSKVGALKYYSGGMYYRKTLDMGFIKDGMKAVLDLSDVVASCEIRVNGQYAGILMSHPYKMDITKYLNNGKNEIEILVYSTLSNHYQTIPTPYRGEPDAGLMGPVKVSVYQ